MLQVLINQILPGKVTVLYGPRQVGKTTLVRSLMDSVTIKSRFFNADELVYREAFASQNLQELSDLVGDAELVIIDEAQRINNIGLNLKLLVDKYPKLKIIATGSASFDLANKVSEPLTGRKLTFTLYPISYAELQKTFGIVEAKQQLDRWMIWGGYPEIITTNDVQLRERLMLELVSSYLYRDLLELEDIRYASKLVDLLRLLAFQIGSEVSISELSTKLASDFRTINRYLDLLEKVFVIFRVGGYSRSLRKEISKSSKYYFYDTGVRNALIQNFNPVNIRNDVGQLWENFLMVERLKANQISGRMANRYFWRTYDQKEIDYIEEREGKLFGYEFKLQPAEIRQATRNEFLSAYPGSELRTIHQENFRPFITKCPT